MASAAPIDDECLLRTCEEAVKTASGNVPSTEKYMMNFNAFKNMLTMCDLSVLIHRCDILIFPNHKDKETKKVDFKANGAAILQDMGKHYKKMTPKNTKVLTEQEATEKIKEKIAEKGKELLQKDK